MWIDPTAILVAIWKSHLVVSASLPFYWQKLLKVLVGLMPIYSICGSFSRIAQSSILSFFSNHVWNNY